jgi:hypothetical protein
MDGACRHNDAPTLTRHKNTAPSNRNRKFLLTHLSEPAFQINQRRLSVKLLYATAFALFSLTAPIASAAQSLDLSLLSALCSDDYYEDTAGQCSVISAGEGLTIEAILTKYGFIITTDDEAILAFLDDLEDMPVGSIQPRNEDAVLPDDKPNAAEPANEQETIASRIITVEPSFQIGGEAADDVATTGPTARRIPAAAEPVDDNRTIE